jgi:hypothetical protein
MGYRKQKLRLYAEDPRCYWCGIETILTNISRLGSKVNPRMATVDHTISRFDPRRWVKGEGKKVLACFKCNQERSAKEVASLTREEILKRSAEGFALNKGPDGKKIITQPVEKVEEVLDIFKKNGILAQ